MSAPRAIPTSQNPDLATVTILVDGTAIPREVSVITCEVVHEINKIPFATFTVKDGDPSTETFEQSDGDLFVPGKQIEIKMGYHSDEETVFKGIITNHANQVRASKSLLKITARSSAVKLTISRNNKTFTEQKDSEIAESIISGYGLEKEIEDSGESLEQLVQYWTTDWDFIISRANRLGKICTISEEKISIKKPDFQAANTLDLLFPSTILDYDAEIDARIQWKGLESRTWSFKDQAAQKTDAAEPEWTEPGNISVTDLAGDTFTGEKEVLLTAASESNDTLQAMADARLMFQRLAKIRGFVTFQGYPGLQPGMMIGLNGVGARFNGNVFVRCVTHQMDKGKYTTKACFGLEPQWFSEKINHHDPVASYGLVRHMDGLQIGIVTDLEDPEGEDRIKVYFPTLEENTGDSGIWCRVASQDAGENRGFFYRPELDDEVICACVGGDIQQTIVLGMLHSSSKPAPFKGSNDNDEKGYVSREQLKLTINDKDKSWVIETPKGKKITLDDTADILQMEDDFGNKITMNNEGITISACSNLKLKAASALSAEGATVSINGSGTTEVKGGLVKIN